MVARPVLNETGEMGGGTIDIIKRRRRIGLLSAGNVAAILNRSYSCCIAAEQTRCQSTVQPIPAQTGGPSQAGPGGLLFTSKI